MLEIQKSSITDPMNNSPELLENVRGVVRNFGDQYLITRYYVTTGTLIGIGRIVLHGAGKALSSRDTIPDIKPPR